MQRQSRYRITAAVRFILLLIITSSFFGTISAEQPDRIDIPDPLIAEAYEKAKTQNILPCVNDNIFPGYFSVCADGIGFGYGYTYPSIDGHQLTDALLWLNQPKTAKENWDYVTGFQKPSGQLPLAIFPDAKGKMIGAGDALQPVDANGGFYVHWVPGDPLRTASSTTYIQNADVIFRVTRDRNWLLQQLSAINAAADFLASLVTDKGAVHGAGYYIERPTRVEFDGVAQCFASESFRLAAALNGAAGRTTEAEKYNRLADRIRNYFRSEFWAGDQCVEYIHPERGKITAHGLTDVDWTALATGMLDNNQAALLWPKLKDNTDFYFGGMPTGICTRPKSYEKWESTYDDVMDLAAMGRVWYTEARARAKAGDAEGLIKTIRAVSEKGRETGYFWRERYNAEGGYGAQKYCEYPANLIRIVQRFLLGVDHGLDGMLMIAPTVPIDFWNRGFGQTLSWTDRQISYTMKCDEIAGTFIGPESQALSVRLDRIPRNKAVRVIVNGKRAQYVVQDDQVQIKLPAAASDRPCTFSIRIGV